MPGLCCSHKQPYACCAAEGIRKPRINLYFFLSTHDLTVEVLSLSPRRLYNTNRDCEPWSSNFMDPPETLASSIAL
jgi:hypothetical protein